jgi:hypothetical protein
MDDQPVAMTDLYMPPGVSFVVYHPEPVQNMDIDVVGEVPDIGVRKPVVPGYNFLALEYNTSRTDEAGEVSYKLKNLGLVQSGFHMGETVYASDQLFLWDLGLADFGVSCWLFDDEGTPKWMTDEEPPQEAHEQEVLPGTGLLIWNSDDGYTWIDGM